jgi:hypothetical protein
MEAATGHQRFVHNRQTKWKRRREYPRRRTQEANEMTITHLTLLLKILAILELLIKALVIYLMR